MSDASIVARPGSPLTAAERRALAVRAECDSDAEAAVELEVSVWTLRTHLKNARSKLRVRSTQRAIRRAARLPTSSGSAM